MCIYVYIYYISVHVLGDFFQKELFMRGLFTNTSFHGETFGENLWGGVVVHGGTYDHIMSREGGGSFINAFSNNLNTVNFFSNHVGIFA